MDQSRPEQELSLKEKIPLLQEQYRQTGEEYRAEDKNTWQTFTIILTLNGALFHFLNSNQAVLMPIFGIIASISGILIIARTGAYQRDRVAIAKKIQEETGIHDLYNDVPISERISNLALDEKYGGRKTMKFVLWLFASLWLGILFFGRC